MPHRRSSLGIPLVGRVLSHHFSPQSTLWALPHGSQLWKVRGRAPSLCQCLLATLAGLSPWDCPLPRMESGPWALCGCLLMLSLCLGSRDGTPYIPQLEELPSPGSKGAGALSPGCTSESISELSKGPMPKPHPTPINSECLRAKPRHFS